MEDRTFRSPKSPIRIRRNVEDYGDPYIDDACLEENTVCQRCGSVYAGSRWYLKDQAPDLGVKPVHEAVCPACRKQRDKLPGGVLTLTGAFIANHKDEILNLVRNQSNKAQNTNPLERIISLESGENEITVTTTNEKLAQRIGRALHKAYSGTIEYRFGEDIKLARVNWRREL